MTLHQPINSDADPAKPGESRARRIDFQNDDDKELLRSARDLTKDLGEARGSIYWSDMLVSTAIGYAGIATAILASNLVVVIVAGLVAVSYTHLTLPTKA